MSDLLFMQQVRLQGGVIRIALVGGRRYHYCSFVGVDFQVSAGAAKDHSPIFHWCHFENCSGRIGDADLDAWGGDKALNSDLADNCFVSGVKAPA